jgi:aspartate 1-decarboxylase
MRWYLRAKIHKAIVTDANVAYEGSITIDTALLDKSRIEAGEKVLVVSNTSGARLETYVIAGAKNSGVICMNGASAHLIKPGEEIIVMAFELSEQKPEVTNILVDKNNKFVKFIRAESPVL